MNISDKIRFHRKQLGLNQTELGLKLGVQKNAVSKWETGRVDDIPTGKVKKLAELFGVPVSYLIDDESELPDAAPAKPKPRTDPAAAAALFESLPEGRREAAMEYMEALRLIEETQSGETALSEKSA